MLAKVLVVIVAIAAASGQHNHEKHHGADFSAQKVHLHNDGKGIKHKEFYAHPKYEYAYEVKDPHTHDFKYQDEQRDGDTVKGVYALHQPDGSVRIVKYYADKKTGFHADVTYEKHPKHIDLEKH